MSIGKQNSFRLEVDSKKRGATANTSMRRKTPHFQSGQQKDYKKLYEQSKQNVKKFISMVEIEMSNIIQKHNQEKQILKKQIAELKTQLYRKDDQRNGSVMVDVSNFTVRTNKSKGQKIRESSLKDQGSFRRRSLSKQFNKTSLECANQSEIKAKIPQITRARKGSQGNLSMISSQNTIFQFENMLQSHHRGNKKSQIDNQNNNATFNSSFNQLKSSKNQSFNRRAPRVKNVIPKQEIIMISSIETQEEKQKQNEKKCRALQEKHVNNYNKTQQSKISQKKSNLFSSNSKGISSSNKKNSTNQNQAQVHSLLKNLRKNMNQNMTKQANLEAPQHGKTISKKVTIFQA